LVVSRAARVAGGSDARGPAQAGQDSDQGSEQAGSGLVVDPEAAPCPRDAPRQPGAHQPQNDREDAKDLGEQGLVAAQQGSERAEEEAVAGEDRGEPGHEQHLAGQGPGPQGRPATLAGPDRGLCQRATAGGNGAAGAAEPRHVGKVAGDVGRAAGRERTRPVLPRPRSRSRPAGDPRSLASVALLAAATNLALLGLVSTAGIYYDA